MNGDGAPAGAPVLTFLRVAAMLAACACASCATRLLELPSGAGTPATDGAEIVAAATASCRQVSTLAAVLAVSGSVGGSRLRGRLEVGLARPSQARLEAVAPIGAPLFIFVARDNWATLLLPRDRRVLEDGRPADVLEAVTGIPIDAETLRVTLTGCPLEPAAEKARALGSRWRTVPTRDGDVYFTRDGERGPWQLVAAVNREPARGDGWRAEYRDFQNSLPRVIRLASADRGRFDVTLALSQVEINTTLDAAVFQLAVPPGTAPITLDELRRSGPLAGSGTAPDHP